MRTFKARLRTGKRAIRAARLRGLDTAEWEAHLRRLWDTALQAAETQIEFEPWALWEWRRVSIPEWRRILAQSLTSGDSHRHEYAMWMLDEVLLDPDSS